MSWRILGLKSPWGRKGYATLRGLKLRPNRRALPVRRRKKRQLPNGSASVARDDLDDGHVLSPLFDGRISA
jgi:hypothetical protein